MPIQVSCLGLEGNLQGNPCRFALTSRGPEGGIQRYVLQASDPAVSQAWIKQVAQILESQRDFLNGEAPILSLQRLPKLSDLLNPFPSHAVSNPCFFEPNFSPSYTHPKPSKVPSTLYWPNEEEGEAGKVIGLFCNTSLFLPLAQRYSHPLNTRDVRARPIAWGDQEGLG